MLASVAVATLVALATVQAAPALQKRDPGYLIAVNGSSPQMCLATPASGAGVTLGDGTGLTYQLCNTIQITHPTAPSYGLWQIASGNNLGVSLSGTSYCLDAGSNPGSQPSVGAKVWTCYPGLAQQQFYYTDDLHIAVTNVDSSCLIENRYGAQFAACGSGAAGGGGVEAFQLLGADLLPPTTTATTNPTTIATSASSATSATPTSTGTSQGGRKITNAGQCLTITSNDVYNGAPVGVAPCSTALDSNQLWTFNYPGQASIRSTAHPGYCIDFGTGGGSNGTPMKVWQCYAGLFQQTMYFTDDAHIAVLNGNQCLDTQAGTLNVQSWQCSGPDVNQLWTVSQ